MVQNFVIGVIQGFKKELEIVGVGYCVQMQGNILKLVLGLFYDVNFEVLVGVMVIVLKLIEIIIEGIDL